jgi:type I restriction enzyme S subunit
MFVFRAMAKEFVRLKYGSTHNTIYMPDVFSFRAPFPPLDEQQKIVLMVRESLRQLDDSFDDLLKSQELLQERRSALISAAVTGQIDVRGLVPEAVDASAATP